MTLTEAKNAIAAKYGRPDWESLVFDANKRLTCELLEQAALLYGEAKWDEGCNATIDRVALVVTDEANLEKLSTITIPAVDIFKKFGDHLKTMPRPQFK